MQTDVAIVGAGPAGGQAARLLAGGGLAVTLVDMRARIGEPVQCGEAISQTALEQNDLRPEDWVMSAVRGVTASAPDAGRAFLVAPGLCIHRGAFDRSVVSMAQSHGAQLWLRCQVRGIAPDNGSYRVETTRGPLVARFVIAADGPWSPMARGLGLVEGWRCNVGLQYKYPADLVAVEEDWLHLFLAERYAGGYAWIFPRGSEVSVGVDVAENPRAHLAAFCRDWGLDLGNRRTTNGGRIPTRIRLRRLGRGNVLVVGDAAGATNPIFGGGIHAALSTGRMAAEAILEDEGSGSGEAVDLYEKRALNSPFFHPVLSRISPILADSSDEDLALAVEVYRRRRTPTKLLQLLPALFRRPSILRKAVRLPALRQALELTARYGW